MNGMNVLQSFAGKNLTKSLNNFKSMVNNVAYPMRGKPAPLSLRKKSDLECRIGSAIMRAPAEYAKHQGLIDNIANIVMIYMVMFFC